MTTKIESRFNATLGNQQKVNISPTLIIGLGGSGKKVCERLRRLFFTKFREPGLPVVDYLYIDTDPKDAAGREGWDVIQEKIAFNAEDMVGVDIKPSEVGHIFRNPNQHRHIFDWFHESLTEIGTDICKNGAGQIRPAGRLAFFHHYSRIRDRVEAKLLRITNGDAINKINENAEEKYNFLVDDKACEVFIIGSVAGGTGSGMFLDMAFLVKDINPDLRPTGLFFLPSLFSHIGEKHQEKIRANGYAALMELDYMIAPSIGVGKHKKKFPKFYFNWDGKEKKSVLGPPFSNVYLLDASNNSGIKPSQNKVSGRDNEAYQMAAEFLFLEFKKSDFSTEKRSLRSNLSQHLVNETKFTSIDEQGFTNYMEYFPNRYSSFGLSFIKLNSVRKKHAAAYFLGKSLASFWGQSQKLSAQEIDDEVSSALTINPLIEESGEKAHTFYERNSGKQWDAAMIKEYFLLKQDEEQANMLQRHLDKVKEDFEALQIKIEEFHKANIATGVDAVFEKMEQFHKECSQEIEQIWLNHLDCMEVALGRRTTNETESLDEELITSNMNICHNLINKGLRDRVFDLISHPHAKGVAWAEKFVDAATNRLTRIANGFTPDPLSEGNCSFKVPQLADNNDIATTKRHLAEAQAIKFPPFRKAATRELDELLRPNQEKEIEARETAFLAALAETRDDLQKRYKLKYEHFIRDKAEIIINRLQDSLSKTEVFKEGKVGEVKKVSGLKGDLALYKGGLENLRAEREQLFEAIDKDSKDIKTINIHSETGDQWYIEQLRTLLHAEATDDWAKILVNQTRAFFDYLSHENNTDCDYIYLLDVCRRWKGKDSDWVGLSNALNTFCFKQVTGFMTEESADDQFQTALQNKFIGEQQLLDVAKRADVWIPPSLIPEERGVSETIIGVPDITESPTADFVQRQTDVFSKAEPQQHENEEIVFYRELGAFPLFRIGSLADYAKDYFDTTGDDIYKRHTDFAGISKLRDIMPPKDEGLIKAINAVGRLLLEALIIRCFEDKKSDDGEGRALCFDPVEKSASPLSPVDIGRDFLRAAKVYSSPENDLYRRALEELISVQKTRLTAGSKDAVFERLKVLSEYRRRIYPTEVRGSALGKSDAQEGFMQIVVSGLYRDYHAACADEVSQGGEYTDAQINNLVAERVEQVDLERVSMEFPYREAQARQDARVMKMPEERS